MQNFLLVILLVYLSVYSEFIYSDTRIESVTPGVIKSSILIKGHKVRIESGMDDTFMLMDTNSKKMLAIMPSQGVAYDIAEMMKSMPKGSSKSSAESSMPKFLHDGAGPKLLGYATEKYSVFVKDRLCGHLFGSKAALQLSGIEPFMTLMQNMTDQAMKMSRFARGSENSCDFAQNRMIKSFSSIGLPLKVVDGKGNILSEITTFEPNARLADSLFQVPGNITTQDMSVMIAPTREMQQQMPSQDDMKEMMQQMEKMQQSGQIPGNAQQRMKEAMEMMNRLQEQ